MNRKKYIKLSVSGFVLGILLCTAITVFTSGADTGTIHLCVPSFEKAVGNNTLALILQTVISGIYGAVVMGSTVVYDIETGDVRKWSLLKATVTHCVITFVFYYVTGFTLHWFSIKDVKENLIMLAVFAVVYTSIWLFNYLGYKREIRNFYKEIEKLNDDEQP